MGRKERRRREKLVRSGRVAVSGVVMEEWFREGVAFHQAGRFRDAEAQYRRVLAADPGNADAEHMLGVLAYQAKSYDDAERLIRAASRKRPDRPDILNNLGNALSARGCFPEAEQVFRSALTLMPEFGDAHYNLGLALKEQGRPDAALESLERAAELQPGDARVHNNRGVVLHALQRNREAEEAFFRAVELNPRHVDALCNLGNVLCDMDRHGEAIDWYHRALAHDPKSVKASENLAGALIKAGFRREAESAAQTALALDPRSVIALNNLGLALRELNRPAEAADCFRRALAIDPHNAKTLLNLARVLVCFEDGPSVREALLSAVENAGGHRGVIQALVLGEFEKVCAWEDTAEIGPLVAAETEVALAEGRCPEETPLGAIGRDENAARHLALSRAVSREVADSVAERPKFRLPQAKSKAKIVVGYVSSDLRNHAVGHLTAGVFERHDHGCFRIHAYSNGRDDGSPYQKRIEAGSDRFVDIRMESDIDVARMIAADKVDILVDLNGHTEGHRLGVFCLRPAPVQASWLGFPGTTGADFLDYAIVDPIVAPKGSEPAFSEALVRLPHCYQANDDSPLIDASPIDRAMYDLPKEGFVFCSFCRTDKIEPVMFGTWMEILNAVPNSVLWLFCREPWGRKNLRAAVTASGIDSARLIFAGLERKDRHLARVSLADLALDTRLYGGHTTTSDMLWAGVPSSLSKEDISRRVSGPASFAPRDCRNW